MACLPATYSHGALVVVAALIAAFCGSPGHAQIAAHLEMDREHYIRYEPINATITLRNYAGNTLVFGTGETSRKVSGYLRFEVIRAGGLSSPAMREDVNPVEQLILAPGETKELPLQLNSIVDFSREGTYNVRFQVSHPRLSHDYQSNSVPIDVREGYPVWRRTVGVPQGDDVKAIPPRTVSLIRFRKQEGQIYALRVEDKRTVYGIVRLGPYLSGSEPECRIDALSNIHLLFQIHPRLLVYRIYDIDVDLKQNLYYVMDETIPTLKREPTLGSVTIQGGRRAIPGKDYKPAPDLKSSSHPTTVYDNERGERETLADPRNPSLRLPEGK